MGLMSNETWLVDPKRLVFVLSRYKFVAKMFDGLARVLEIGCADAFGTRIVCQAVGELTAVDFDPLFITEARDHWRPPLAPHFAVHDMCAGPLTGPFDGAYTLDVIEHVRPEDEKRFVANIVASLTPEGVLIVGTPSIQSQVFASPPSREGHVNCMDLPGLKALLSGFFANVFVFSMNDEVVHTGFHPMAHYLLALCCGPRPASKLEGRAG